MKKIKLALLGWLWLVFYPHLSLAAAILVFDPEAVIKMTEQINQMRDQLAQAKKQYEALTGSRQLGAILYDRTLNQFLPAQGQNIYHYPAAEPTRTALINSLRQQETPSGSIETQQQQLLTRLKEQRLTDKAIGFQGYEGATKRLNQIESLMNQVSRTQDLKALGELHARIGVEQTVIQNELTRVQLLHQLSSSETQLINEQKEALHRQLLNPNHQHMARIN